MPYIERLTRRGQAVYSLRARVDGKQKRLGVYASESEAMAAFDALGLPTKHYRTMRDRLRAYVERAENGCLLWTGYADREGYGRVSITDRDGMHIPLLVHRESYREFVGPLVDGLTIDHTCHNRDLTCAGGTACLHRLCIEPTHLEQVAMEINRDRAVNRRNSLLHAIELVVS